ncbi:MFS transporter [Geodermatophilus sp. CPCC 205506]|uniref:MFS transporter n=1 Tax=Geodermatophilus sp. CPCC 205506 TaxID=2936596 RepID=UPI003EE98248
MIPHLSRSAWTVLGGDALSAIGSGLTLPFFVVYLHRVRGLDVEVAALALATVAVVGLAGNLIGGSLADRFGARDALMFGLVLNAAGTGAMTLVHAPWQAFAAAATLGLGASIAWPAQDALLATVSTPDQRSSVFSVRHMTLNAGFGIGALVAALIVDVDSPGTFVALYLLDAATFLAFIPILMTVKAGNRPQLSHETSTPGLSAGYRRILTDWTFVRIWLLTALLVAAGFSQMHAMFPVFALGPGGIGEDALSVAFAANTFTVVAAQLFVLRWMQGRRRTTGMVLTCGFWGAAWGMTLLAGMIGGGPLAVATLVGALVVFAIGETVLTPTLLPMVNDLVPDALRGRYNGVYTLAWTTGFMLGPAVAGVALGAGHATAFLLGLIGGLALAAGAAWRVSAHVPPGANRIGASEPAAAPSPDPVQVTTTTAGEVV